MEKKKKQKHLIAVLVLLLLTFSAYATLISPVHAAGADLQEKGLSVLNNIVGIDTTKYALNINHQDGNSSGYLGVVSQDVVTFDLTSENSKLKALYTFTDGKTQMIQLLENKGDPNLTKPATRANIVEKAQAYLTNYEKYETNPLFGELKTSLNHAVPDKNFTKTVGNIVLEVTANDEYTNFKGITRQMAPQLNTPNS